MYDTVKFTLYAEDAPNTDFLSETSQYTQGTKAITEEGELSAVMGYLDNLKVIINRNTVRITEGSLCKWYLGSNLNSLTLQTTGEAIEKLCDTLHLPMHNADLTRIDVAHNLIMNYPIKTYFEHLGHLKHYKRLTQPDGLRYTNGLRTFYLYDKIKEQKSKKELIPEALRGKNVLRCEMRFTKRLREEFGLKRVTASTLTESRFYNRLLDRFGECYRNIVKVNDLAIDFDKIKTNRHFNMVANASFIESWGGGLEVIRMVTEAQSMGGLTKKQAYDFKQLVKKCNASPIVAKQSRLIQELDAKIAEALQENYIGQ